MISRRVFSEKSAQGFRRRAYVKAAGFSDYDLERPLIGIANTWSELGACHYHLRDLAEAVKRGVWQAGGFPVEFNAFSVNEILCQVSSLIYRNLVAIDTEELILSQPLDGVVLLSACDKHPPGQLMGAASADVPAIILTGGPMLSGHYGGEAIGCCSDSRRLWTEHRAGNLGEAELTEMENAIAPSCGTCTVMGTASTMAAMCEALGMALPGTAAIPAVDARRRHAAEATGRQIVEAVRQGLRPSRIMTPAAFDNAIKVLMALGGSTNAVIHLTAIARRLGIALSLERFDQLSRSTPWLATVKPNGPYLMEDFYRAGGVPALMAEILPLLDGMAPTITGRTLAENVRGARVRDRRVIAALGQPQGAEGGLAVLRGNLAPNGAVIKSSAASPGLLRHRGPAVVFDSYEQCMAHMNDDDYELDAAAVLVVRNEGPIGGPGMPESGGNITLPRKLLRRGVRDVVRVTDARMSGTAFGTIVLHVDPESAVGGPLAAVRSGDEVELDVPNRRLQLRVSDEEIARRLAAWQAPRPTWARGYRALYLRHVTQASLGCDLDFM